jgi:hypothetical protein
MNAHQRFDIFALFDDVQNEKDVEFFVVAIDANVYLYHKKDSIECRQALISKTVAALTTTDFPRCSGRLIISDHKNELPTWWPSISAALVDTTHWFVMAIQRNKLLFSAISEHFPSTPERQQELKNVVMDIWEETQLADIAYASGVFLSKCIDATCAAATDIYEKTSKTRLV